MSDDSAFAIIENARRIWAIGSIHGEADKLAALHERLSSRLAPGDRLIYLGNYLGYGPAIIETVDEILSFRRKFLARPPFTDTNDHILLRGSQEEMWQRILQLQFAVDPIKVVTWMAERGLASTLAAYAGESPQEILGQRAGPLDDRAMDRLRSLGDARKARAYTVHERTQTRRYLSRKRSAFRQCGCRYKPTCGRAERRLLVGGSKLLRY